MSNIAPPQQRYWKERYAEMLEMPSEKAYGVAVENAPAWDPLTDPLVIRGPWRPEDLRQAAHILEWDRGGIGMDPNISDRWLYICGVLIDGGLRRSRSPEEARRDAALKDSAPDLLLCLAWLLDIEGQNDRETREEQRPLALAAARSAITKATGSSEGDG